MQKANRSIFYLRTDICYEKVKAGGSVTHTIGVIDGFANLDIKVYCASSAMKSILWKKKEIYIFKKLRAYPLFFFLRWKLDYFRWQMECLFSNFFFLWQLKKKYTTKKFLYCLSTD